MQETNYSAGPKFFGTTAKKSWFDEGDRCAPGPGAHEPARLNNTNPPTWTQSKDTQRDSFLMKQCQKNPSPDKYKIPNPDVNHPAEPKHQVPKFTLTENLNKVDEGSVGDYKPRMQVNKQKYPHYSFGYNFDRDYSTKVPPPNTYNAKKTDRKCFNKTQRSFSVGERPMPYGQEGKYPYVGKYTLRGEMGGTRYSIGRGDRPHNRGGSGADGDYNISGDILKTGQGKTVGLLIEVPRNKDSQEFPPPNQYNPLLPRTDRNIINYRARRSQIKNQSIQKYPSPDRYQPKIKDKEQTISFTKELRVQAEPEPYPGVGSYQVEKRLDNTLGHMARKLNKLTEFVGPAPSAYDPNDNLTKPQNQRPINYESDRIDFSKSITGKNIGPGVYQTEKEQKLSLGKMGKGDKFDPNRNKNPGPGSYQIASGIGKLPKYCCGPKKLTNTGFSVIQLQKQQRTRRDRVRYQARVRAQQEQQQKRLLMQQQQVAE